MDFQVTVIGSGPGGYVAAIRAAQLGFKTCLIERYNTLGGTCLNVGCIPSKALLDSSEHYFNATHNFKTHGIEVSDVKPNFEQMIARKADVVKQTIGGIEFLMKKNNITVKYGHGTLADKNTIKIAGEKGEETITSEKIVLATGSKPATIPGVEIDKKRVITSTEALELKEIPNTMVVIGAGVIGAELGSVYSRLGTEVTFLEYAPAMIPTMDETMGKELLKVFKKEGIRVNLSEKVKSAKATGDKVKIESENKKGELNTYEADYCLVAVGRKPYTQNLGLENAGIKTDDRGRIEVNEKLQTTAENIYAIGDVVKGAMLAHKAEEEGVFVAEVMAGQKPHIHYNLIPSVVYTWPEVAGVGATEKQLKDQGKAYKVGSYPFKALGRSRASMDTDGVVKILADKQTDEILGFHVIGPRAADLIAEGVVAMEYRASAEDLARMSHPHPTYTEAIKEACLDATAKRALHM